VSRQVRVRHAMPARNLVDLDLVAGTAARRTGATA
jgi:hypothetical protein